MKFVDKPKIFHLARSTPTTEIVDYLAFLGAPNWSSNAKNDAELLIELAGRRCYKSFGTELNPNLAKVREGNPAKYIDEAKKLVGEWLNN